MPSLFARPSNLLSEQTKKLYDYKDGATRFTNEPAHKELISECTLSVKRTLANLQEIDKRMTAGFTAGIAALAISWILPIFVPLAIAGLAYGAYQLGKRQQAYIEYKNALENSIECCDWSLGKITRENYDAYMKNDDLGNKSPVASMIDTLGPLTTTEQLNKLIDDAVEKDANKEAQPSREHIQLFDNELDKEKRDLYSKIYGYEQGGFLAVLQGVGYAIQNAFLEAKKYFTAEVPSNVEPAMVMSNHVEPAHVETSHAAKP